jgi:hypothetical protein
LALIFSSGGGRLGNQILNLIHLMALVFEHNISVYKICDNCLISVDGNIIFKLNEKEINWRISNNYLKGQYLYKLLIKVFIRFIHIYFYLSPFDKSYKFGSINNYPKFILADNLGAIPSISKLINESRKHNVVISGWGLRDWDMVLKHKKAINKSLKEGLGEFMNFDNSEIDDYLLVHIRRTDFLDVNEFKKLNFEDEIWLKSIKKICSLKGIKKVVLFSDALIDKFFISVLELNQLKVILPELRNKNVNFLKLFFSHVNKSKYILCNASSLILSIAFISHKKIYLPSRDNEFQEIFLDNAHNSFPTLINWN